MLESSWYIVYQPLLQVPPEALTVSARSLQLAPLRTDTALKGRVYEALKAAITTMDIYGTGEPPKLDERRLADELGVSRTPVREALSRLESEGLVQTIARRGAFVVRKSKAEIIEMIHVWAGLESMAARLATQRASTAELAGLQTLVASFDAAGVADAHIDEYSETNIAFHQAIIALGGNRLITDITNGLFVHMRAIRARTISERDRAARSVIDHSQIVEALIARDGDRAAHLVREHSMNLAAHVERYVDDLD